MDNYERILERLRLRLIDAARMNWMDTIIPDDNQQPEARRVLELDNFEARGFFNEYVKHTRDDRAALEK